MVTIDGSYGEGGGQILRTALSLAAVTGTTVRINNVRASRSNPGLSPQHVMAARTLTAICGAETRGAELGSTEVIFRPRRSPEPGRYVVDMAEAVEGGSAGSVTLLFQALLYPLSLAGQHSHLILRGGTHVAWSPSFDYIRDVYLPHVAAAGIEAECRLNRWGFYPNGGGEVAIDITPLSSPLSSFEILERGALQRVTGRGVASNLPAHIPQRMVNRASNLLENHGLAADITASRVTGAGPGAGIFLTAHYDHVRAGFSALGKPGKPSEKVAEEAADELLHYHEIGAPVDKRLADQLLLPSALADGTSTYRVTRATSHLATNAHIIEQMLPVRIDIDTAEDRSGRVTVTGTGTAPKAVQ